MRSAKQKTYDFRLSGSVVRFDGFLQVYEADDEKSTEFRRTIAWH